MTTKESPSPIPAFSLDQHGIDEVAFRLGELYKDVGISKEPTFAWVQIANDITILTREIRRNHPQVAAERAAKVLFRLLEFLGYYTYIHQDSGCQDFSDCLSDALRKKSYEPWFLDGPPEGPTRWILAKYPRACSKCGQKPCHCIIEPWVVEERRENPLPYLKLRLASDSARQALRVAEGIESFSIMSMLKMFDEIYRNTFYYKEPWELALSLLEEIGEATIELGRLELAWRGRDRGFDINGALNLVKLYAREKIDGELKKALAHGSAEANAIEQFREHLLSELKTQEAVLENGNVWDCFFGLVANKFKENVADVFSWISAMLLKLDGKHGILEGQRRRFVNEGLVETLRCPWCGSDFCTDMCFVTHGVANELVEKVTRS